ncbi:MAG: hypothetical protein EOO48_05805, partial [Flavobacterium sp.]
MKTTLLFSLLVTCCAFGQTPISDFYGLPTVPPSNVPDGNTHRTYKSATADTPIDETATGGGQTWNFTNLIAGGFVDVDNTLPTPTETAQYPGTTMVSTQTPNGGGTSSKIYLNSSSATSFTGADTNGILLNYSTNNATIGTFPLTFGYANTDTMSGTYSYTTYSGTFTGTITSAVDAYGTLNTNDVGFGPQSFAVTRLKIVQNISLTYIFPNAGTVVITSYLYYRDASTSGDHFPIFNSTTTSVNIPLLSINQTTTGYLSAGGALLGTPTFLQNSVSLWPNPVKDILNISSADATLKSISITDANG